MTQLQAWALLHTHNGMCAAGHGRTKPVLLSTANILLLFAASSPGQAQERGQGEKQVQA